MYTGICAFFSMGNLCSQGVFHRCMANWRKGWGLCTLVSVHTSIFITYEVKGSSTDVWSFIGGGQVCLLWYLCILLYVKLIQARGLPQMYGQLEEGWGMSAQVSVHTSIFKTYAVKGSSTDVWSFGGEGEICLHWYLCILLYLKCSQCSGLPYIYGQWEKEMGSICHGCMCILLYRKLIWCSGFP